jgi:hypothetical protein
VTRRQSRLTLLTHLRLTFTSTPRPPSTLLQLAASQKGLRRLSLQRCLGVDAAGALLFAVNSGPTLQHVDVSSVAVSWGQGAVLVGLLGRGRRRSVALPSRRRCLAHASTTNTVLRRSPAPRHSQGLTDAALVALSRVGQPSSALESLDVSMCRGITDAGLGCMADGCPRLRRLVVWGCSQISGRFYLGHKRARVPSPYELDPAALAAARERLEARRAAAAEGAGAGAGAGSSSSSASAAGADGDTDASAAGGLSDVDVEALAMAPLRVYGKPGDVMAAPDYE